jgi:hypothetical protein
MGEPGAVWRDEAGNWCHHHQPDERNEAEREWRQQRLVRKAGEDITYRAAMVTGTPSPAEVATALWIGLP